MCADILHTFHLGVLLEFTKLVLWDLLLASAWGRTRGTDENFAIAVLALRADLWAWYDARAAGGGGEVLIRLADLTGGMLGNPRAGS